jgi:hypothetical protein
VSILAVVLALAGAVSIVVSALRLLGALIPRPRRAERHDRGALRHVE